MSADVIKTTYELRVHDYLYLVPITFLYWDHLMTFGDEVRYLWNRPKTLSTCCFLLNRYLAAFGDIVVTVFVYTTVPGSVCKRINLYRQILLIVNQILICVLLTIRIYALFERSKRVAAAMLGPAAGLLVVSIWAVSFKGGDPEPGVEGCHIANSWEIGVHLAVPWEALFLYDFMIFVGLFTKSYVSRREAAPWTGITLLGVLIRDGAIYFGVMAAMNLANIMTFYFASPLLRGCLSTFASSMSVTLMSRLMLNLHSVESNGIFSTATHIGFGTSLSYYDHSGPVELDTLYTRDLERRSFSPGRSTRLTPPMP
ncbi:hypothetical protein C8J57DRAFT_1312801 [Mycena rebaudengoi]|nr:hypothetical protein C8J57DRAFT_1312801 [Mycena rebaudengoi]